MSFLQFVAALFDAIFLEKKPSQKLRIDSIDKASSRLNGQEYQDYLNVASATDLEQDAISQSTLGKINTCLRREGLPCLRLKRNSYNPYTGSYALERGRWKDTSQSEGVRPLLAEERMELFKKAFM